MIDTGSRWLVVEEEQLRALGIEPNGFEWVQSVTSSVPEFLRTYDVSVNLDGLQFIDEHVVGGKFNAGFSCLIGRTVLHRLTSFLYESHADEFSLRW